jgi:hypothetical protein
MWNARSCFHSDAQDLFGDAPCPVEIQADTLSLYWYNWYCYTIISVDYIITRLSAVNGHQLNRSLTRNCVIEDKPAEASNKHAGTQQNCKDLIQGLNPWKR